MINNTTVENKHTTTSILATVYPITFEGATDANGYPLLKVTITDTEGAVMNLVYNIDYALVYDDNQEGNDESLNEPHLNGIKFLREELAVAGNSLSIIRNTPFVQPIDFQVGRIDPEQAENAADKSVLRDQELRNQMVKDEAVIDDHEERIAAAEETIDDHEERLTTAEGTIDNHERRLTTAEGDIDTIEGTLSGHLINFNNPHQTTLLNLNDTNIVNPRLGQFIMFDGLKWKNVSSSATASWGTILGDITDQTDLMNKFTEYVRTDGTSIMTTPLKFRAGSMRGAVGPYLNGVSFWKLDSQGSITNIANLTDSQFLPVTTNAIDLGRSANKWKDLYLAGKVYVATINNGADLTVPNKTGTLATMDDVELAARSGRMLTDQGKWYAKMYSSSTVPTGAEYDGRNYADFSQVDQDDNPIIVIYEGQDGNWVQSETITPPAEYDGYVSITSKIWDIVEQAGQQGGRVLWNHTSKEFTPEPRIISTNDIEITGESTVIMPENPSDNQITNKKYVDDAVAEAASQAGYRPSILVHEWDDHERSDISWLDALPFSWHNASAYEVAYNELFNDIYISTSWYASGYANVYTKSPKPAAGDTVYSDSACTTSVGTVTSYDELNNSIVYSGTTYTYNSNSYVTPASETVAGYTVSVYTGHSGRKITIPSYETAVSNIYTATGVAWYYIIDVPNKRFKLPRVNPDKEEILATIGVRGTGMTLGLKGATGNGAGLYSRSGTYNFEARTTAYGQNIGNSGGTEAKDGNGSYGVTNDITKSGIVADTSSKTSYFSGKKHLYFYVGSFTQTALENTAGLNAELFNDKVDVGHEVIAFQAPTAGNNYTWYRKYRDGWVEQGGIASSGSSSVTFPITMADTNYYFNVLLTGDPGFTMHAIAYNYTTAGCTVQEGQYATTNRALTNSAKWEVKGMAAE